MLCSFFLGVIFLSYLCYYILSCTSEGPSYNISLPSLPACLPACLPASQPLGQPLDLPTRPTYLPCLLCSPLDLEISITLGTDLELHLQLLP
ncbi:uncharacterized protein GGS25DRAFT_504370 [Hypoxylon fragiforme]|uniref:uncharacterized protein n=1 Tax=Hypoxylon fragiforme TaxID=63214 RepID=UPI0020C62E7D|nr:uncharacterized protein GGS25DRAFT_504370 [Hypoxylon fragiforme]KAI2605256.1 hypothetical protein GGS25DRAFT_504370 [Hypoxylon fragiforme]